MIQWLSETPRDTRTPPQAGTLPILFSAREYSGHTLLCAQNILCNVEGVGLPSPAQLSFIEYQSFLEDWTSIKHTSQWSEFLVP